MAEIILRPSRTVRLHSHRDVTNDVNASALHVRHNGGHTALVFDRYWTSFHVAMSEQELRELRDAITQVLDEQTAADIETASRAALTPAPTTAEG